jgi:hypothetical protein
MDIATLRDFVIVIYGSMGILIVLALGVIAFLLYGKVAQILDDVICVMNKVKTISAYASKEVIEPLIALSVAIQSAAEGLRQLRRIFTGKGGNE